MIVGAKCARTVSAYRFAETMKIVMLEKGVFRKCVNYHVSLTVSVLVIKRVLLVCVFLDAVATEIVLQTKLALTTNVKTHANKKEYADQMRYALVSNMQLLADVLQDLKETLFLNKDVFAFLQFAQQLTNALLDICVSEVNVTYLVPTTPFALWANVALTTFALKSAMVTVIVCQEKYVLKAFANLVVWQTLTANQIKFALETNAAVPVVLFLVLMVVSISTNAKNILVTPVLTASIHQVHTAVLAQMVL